MKIDIEQRNKAVIVKLPRNFYIGNIVDVEDVWAQVVASGPEVVGFDCDMLEFIDSSALGTLVKFFNNSVKNNISMYVFGLSQELLKIFETTKIDRVMSVISAKEFEDKYPLQ